MGPSPKPSWQKKGLLHHLNSCMTQPPAQQTLQNGKHWPNCTQQGVSFACTSAEIPTTSRCNQQLWFFCPSCLNCLYNQKQSISAISTWEPKWEGSIEGWFTTFGSSLPTTVPNGCPKLPGWIRTIPAWLSPSGEEWDKATGRHREVFSARMNECSGGFSWFAKQNYRGRWVLRWVVNRSIPALPNRVKSCSTTKERNLYSSGRGLPHGH